MSLTVCMWVTTVYCFYGTVSWYLWQVWYRRSWQPGRGRTDSRNRLKEQTHGSAELKTWRLVHANNNKRKLVHEWPYYTQYYYYYRARSLTWCQNGGFIDYHTTSNIDVRGSHQHLTPGCLSFSLFSPLTRFHAWNSPGVTSVTLCSPHMSQTSRYPGNFHVDVRKGSFKYQMFYFWSLKKTLNNDSINKIIK